MSSTTQTVDVAEVREYLKPHAFGKTAEEVAKEFGISKEDAENVLTRGEDKGRIRKVGDNWRWSS